MASRNTARRTEDVPESGAFVGREREIRILSRALDKAVAGTAGVVAICGEPGVGKTRLATEVIRIAKSAGIVVAVGRSLDGDAVPPLFPWISCARGYLRSPHAAEGTGLDDLARFWDRDRGGAPALSEDRTSGKYRLFDAVASGFRRATETAPLLIVLDDLHRADRLSLELLQFLVPELRDCRLLLVCTYRQHEVGADHPLSAVLGGLATEPGSRSITLSGLAETEVAELSSLELGSPPAPGLVRRLWERTDGARPSRGGWDGLPQRQPGRCGWPRWSDAPSPRKCFSGSFRTAMRSG